MGSPTVAVVLDFALALLNPMSHWGRSVHSRSLHFEFFRKYDCHNVRLSQNGL